MEFTLSQQELYIWLGILFCISTVQSNIVSAFSLILFFLIMSIQLFYSAGTPTLDK